MGFILSRRSLKNLEGVHQDLVNVVKMACCKPSAGGWCLIFLGWAICFFYCCSPIPFRMPSAVCAGSGAPLRRLGTARSLEAILVGSDERQGIWLESNKLCSSCYDLGVPSGCCYRA